MRGNDDSSHYIKTNTMITHMIQKRPRILCCCDD